MINGRVKILELLGTLDRLKHLKRTGWVRFGVPEPETVASHMYRMAVLSMTLVNSYDNIDVDKCVRMALVHDISEAIVGDITPHCGISKERKSQLEEEALTKIVSYLPDSMGVSWFNLWKEYESGNTLEARMVKQMDKLDMIAQALSYEEKYHIDLSEFFNATIDSFNCEPFIEWAEEIRKKRTKIL